MSRKSENDSIVGLTNNLLRDSGVIPKYPIKEEVAIAANGEVAATSLASRGVISSEDSREVKNTILNWIVGILAG